MPTKSPHFYWKVPEQGFEWITSDTKSDNDENTATVLHPKKIDDDWRTYFPLKNHTGLFQEFARLEYNIESILEFANRYGNLVCNHKNTPIFDTDNCEHFVSLADWQHEILSTRQVLELWQMANTLDLNNLLDHIEWTENTIIFHDIYNPGHRNRSTPYIICVDEIVGIEGDNFPRLHTHIPVTQKTYSNFKKEDPSKPALYLIQHIANYKIKGLIKPQLLLDDHKNKLNLKMKPSSLIGALWLQCIMAINNRKVYAECSTCHQWFELPANVVNKGKKYCTDACKSKAYRARKKKKVA